jgi:hypothetical protein
LYEKDVPDAAKAAEQPGFSPEDLSTILKHIRAALIRNPGVDVDADADATRLLALQGVAKPSKEEIQQAREGRSRASP